LVANIPNVSYTYYFCTRNLKPYKKLSVFFTAKASKEMIGKKEKFKSLQNVKTLLIGCFVSF